MKVWNIVIPRGTKPHGLKMVVKAKPVFLICIYFVQEKTNFEMKGLSYFPTFSVISTKCRISKMHVFDSCCQALKPRDYCNSEELAA